MEVRVERPGGLAPAAWRRRGGRMAAARVWCGWGLGSPVSLQETRQYDTDYCLINHEGVHVFI